MEKDVQRIDMFETPKPKKYCIRGMHAGIIAAVVVVVGVSVGLGVGLTRPEPCKNGGAETTTTLPLTSASTTAGTQQPEFCPASDDQSGGWTAFRLPDYINPVHYDVAMQPFMDQNTYSGNVTIWLRVSQQTSYLWLHIRETKISGAPRLSRGDQEIQLHDCFHYLPNEYLVLRSHNVLEATSDSDAEDTYQLTLPFTGRLDGSLVGFYMTSYVENGETKYIAATDHEPTDARKSFPCFDEPNKKATYTISIIHKEEYNALSNMPVQNSVSIGNGWKRTVFLKSVPMSTYLVCFAVHQFTNITQYSKSGIPLTIYVQPTQQNTAEYAAGVTKIIFDHFEEYFNMSYSLPKLDQIAIPDFGTGAMENWGLVTYRETNLLYDPSESATSNKQRVAAVIAHELVHQWFGNIVTMDWWDDLWLNEGFASFFEYIGVNKAEPTWNMLDQILIDDLLPVMKDDALQSSHPIIVDVSTPAEITSVFDAISYNKGASILRMLQDWISPESFQKGCQNYLVKYHFKNAKTDDFWNSLAEASGEPVKEVMDTWTRQMGYPVLNLQSSNIVTQTRFLLDSKANASEPPSVFSYKWNIPVSFYATAVGQTHSIIYNGSENAGIALNPYNPTTDGFLKINPSHIGFFRVNYEKSTWDALANLLLTNHKVFTEGDRAGLIDDVFALASAEKLDYNITLDMTKYLESETEYFPWHRVSSSLAHLTDMLGSDDTIYPKFQAYFRKKVKPITDKLTWEDTGSDRDKLLRALVLQMSCRMGDQEALRNASDLFERWLNGASIPVNLRQLVYRYGIKQHGTPEAWDFMFHKYLNTQLAQEKEKLLQGLASVDSIPLIDRYLKFLYNTSLIKSQDTLNVIYYISLYSKYGKQMSWDWVRLNWEYLVNRYGIADRNLGRIVLRITGTYNSEAELWQMENFFERYPEAGAGATPRKQAVETVKNNIEWVAANKQGIKAWLEDNA